MAERIRKIPLQNALAAMDVAWQDADHRLIEMGPKETVGRAIGAMYYDSSHPFRDKLHIEGIQAGLEFALTGKSAVVDFWMQRAAAIKSGEVQPHTPVRIQPPSRLQIALIGLTHGLGLRDAWRIFRSKPVSVGE